MRTGGRRPGLVFAYVVGALGALIVVAGAALDSVPLLFLGILLFGGGNAANLQARYAAVDLADPDRRARQLSLVVWATTIGAVAGPNLAPVADQAVAGLGLREYAGPFLFSALAFVVAAVASPRCLRPDPLLTARPSRRRPPRRRTSRPRWCGAAASGSGRPAWSPASRAPAWGCPRWPSGTWSWSAVMSMTPVHLGESAQ